MSVYASTQAARDMAGQGHGRRLARLLLDASPLLLAAAVYGYAVTLPFFLDDGPHFQILAQTDGLRHWGDFPPFPFYRPLTFTIWKLFEPFGYSAPVMHWLNALCFGAAGVLVGSIARRLAPADWRVPAGLFAGWFFVLFPFGYQAVVMVAALFHLTLALGLLVSIWSALNWLGGQGGQPMLVVCWLGAFVGIFSHETGVLLVPLLAGAVIALCRGRWQERRKLALVFLPLLALSALYVLLWLSFSPREDTGLTNDLAAGLAVLAQGLIYPFAAALRPFITGDIQPALLLLLVGAVMAVVLVLLRWCMPQIMLRAGYGLAWYALAIIPAAVALSAGYALGQPRLALLASAGGGMFWGLALAGLTRNHRWLVLLIALAFFGVSGEFLWMRRVDFLRLRDWNRQTLALIDANNAIDTGALLVNAPDYITPSEDDRRFLLGTEGALFVDETLDYNQQFWMNSELEYANIEVIAVPAIQRSSGFNFRAHPPEVGDPAVGDAPLVIVTQFDGKRFYPVLVGGTALDSDSEVQPLAELGEGAFALLAGEATFDPNEQAITVRLRWQANQPDAVKVFVHVTCDGALVAQSDGYPWGDLYPFAAWSDGETQVDIRRIPLDVAYLSRCLRVLVGLYFEAGVVRLDAVDARTGERFPDDAVPVAVE